MSVGGRKGGSVERDEGAAEVSEEVGQLGEVRSTKREAVASIVAEGRRVSGSTFSTFASGVKIRSQHIFGTELFA